jgi:hypothetical protein
MDIPKEVRDFIAANAEVICGQKNEYYIESIEVQHYWCFVLEGLVAGYRTNLAGKQIIAWLSVENSYFTGTKHPFSNRRDDIKIKFLENSKIVQLPNYFVQFAQKEYPSVSELLHTLKQKKLSDYEKRIEIFSQDSKIEQFLKFEEHYPKLPVRLSVGQICAFLNMDRSTYYEALKTSQSLKRQ